jgi:hypothetical protein
MGRVKNFSKLKKGRRKEKEKGVHLHLNDKKRGKN